MLLHRVYRVCMFVCVQYSMFTYSVQDPHSIEDPIGHAVTPSSKDNTLKFSHSPKKMSQLSKYTVSPVSKST